MDIGHDHDFHRSKQGHHRRHADRETASALPLALAAGGLIGETRFEDGLIFGCQRGLLGATPGFVRVKRCLAGDPGGRAGPEPLALQVRILRVIERPRAADCREQHRREGDCTDRAPKKHASPPCNSDPGGSPGKAEAP
jgi:hypothetical protein